MPTSGAMPRCFTTMLEREMTFPFPRSNRLCQQSPWGPAPTPLAGMIKKKKEKKEAPSFAGHLVDPTMVDNDSLQPLPRSNHNTFNGKKFLYLNVINLPTALPAH